MKAFKLTAYLVTSLMIISSEVRAQKRDFEITGSLIGLTERDTVFLMTYNDAKTWVPHLDPIPWDTIVINAGTNTHLNYKGKVVADGKLYALGIKGREGLVSVLISEGEKIMVKGNINVWPNIELGGSKEAINMQEYQQVFAPLTRDKKLVEASAFRKMFLRRHPNSLYSAYVILMNMDMSPAERKKAYENLTRYVKESYFGLLIAKGMQEKTLFQPIKEGYNIPNFQVLSQNGEMLDIYRLISESKYTLIDFWASWCVPCRKSFSDLLKVDSIYRKEGLSIVGIAVKDKKAEWTKALAEEKSTWTQVFDQEGTIANVFMLGSIPAMVLVDQRGKLISFSCAASGIAPFGPWLKGEDLFKTLDRLFE